MSKTNTNTVEAFRKLLSKQSKPQFMAACKTHNVEWVDGPRAMMIEAIVASAFPSEPLAEVPVEQPVAVPVASPAPVAVAANNVATEPAATAVAVGVPELIAQLRSATSPLVKKRIRRALRKAGHRGGLGRVEETPVV